MTDNGKVSLQILNFQLELTMAVMLGPMVSMGQPAYPAST